MSARVLVLGGSGQVGSHVAAGVRAAGGIARVATRRPSGPDEVAFDWDEPTTTGPALAGIDAVHLLPPQGDPDPMVRVSPLLDRAATAGVRRIVLLGSSAIGPDDPGLGEVHAHLAATWSGRDGRGWAVLRPTWFMQNFTGDHLQARSIREADEVVSATEHGAVAFVDVADIAAVSVRALLDPTPHDRDHLITGPEALTYDDVASVVASACGRPVTHRRAEPGAWAREIATRTGVPEPFATLLVDLDLAVARGEQAEVTTTVEDVTGRPPTAFADHCRRLATTFAPTVDPTVAAGGRPARG